MCEKREFGGRVWRGRGVVEVDGECKGLGWRRTSQRMGTTWGPGGALVAVIR